MNHLQALRDLGQSLWLDNITREILDNGTLKRYIDEFRITGLTSNPTIFDEAIGNSDAYDAGIREKAAAGKSGEALFVELALEDLRRAADLFRPVFDATARRRRLGVDGSVAAAGGRYRGQHRGRHAHPCAGRRAPTCSSRFPGTPEGVPAIEESIFNGVPINVTLLFSHGAIPGRGRGLPARHRATHRGGTRSAWSARSPRCSSAAGTRPAPTQLPAELRNRLGIAVAQRTYRAYRELLASPRWQKLAGAGAQPQRLLWASTGTKDPAASDTLYIEALAAPDTIDTMPEKTLHAFADHGKVRRRDGRGWWRCRGHAADARQGRHRHRRTGDAAAGAKARRPS